MKGRLLSDEESAIVHQLLYTPKWRQIFERFGPNDYALQDPLYSEKIRVYPCWFYIANSNDYTLDDLRYVMALPNFNVNALTYKGKTVLWYVMGHLPKIKLLLAAGCAAWQRSVLLRSVVDDFKDERAIWTPMMDECCRVLIEHDCPAGPPSCEWFGTDEWHRYAKRFRMRRSAAYRATLAVWRCVQQRARRKDMARLVARAVWSMHRNRYVWEPSEK